MEVENLPGSLNRLADKLGVKRTGNKHQAGSDSLLTLDTYLELMNEKYKNRLDLSKEGKIYGIMDFDKMSEYSNESNTNNYFIPSPFGDESPQGLMLNHNDWFE